MKLQKKLTIWSIISLVFISAVGIVSWFGIRQLLATIESVDHTYQMIQHSLQLKNYIYKLEANEEHYILLLNEFHLKKYNDNKKLIKENLDFLLKEVRTPNQKNLVNSINLKVINWENNIANVEINSEDKRYINNLEAHKKRVIDSEVLLSEATLDLDVFIENEKRLMDQRRGKVVSKTYKISTIIIASIVLFVLLYTIISYFLSKSIVKPLLAATVMMKNIAEGKADLTKRLQSKSNDELRELVNWFNIFIIKLHKIMTHIHEENISVKNSSSELSTTATALANNAVETSSRADELFSGVEDVAQTLDFTKEKSSKYITGSKEILFFIQSEFLENVSYETNQITTIKENIEHTSNDLLEVNKQVLNMKDVIESIDDLSSQSKILSVNASIQATKAGEYGKGFDVVAKEIKELAHKSKNSVKIFSKSIKGILKISNTAGLSVEKSSNFINNSISNSESLKNILVKHSDNISDLAEGMDEISSIFDKQHDDTAVLLDTAKRIKLSTETNAQGAKKIQNAADNLEEFSVRLNSLIDDFKI